MNEMVVTLVTFENGTPMTKVVRIEFESEYDMTHSLANLLDNDGILDVQTLGDIL